MADTLRNSFDPTKRFTRVVFQRGRARVDAEDNESQDIQRVNSYLGIRNAGDENLWAANKGETRDMQLPVVPAGVDDTVTVKAGLYQFGGYMVELDTDVNVVLTAASQCVYAQITESEVSGADDSSIVYSALGETTRRTRLNVSFLVGTIQAYSSQLSRPWLGHSAKFVVAHVFRAATGAVAAADIVQRLQLPADAISAQNGNTFMWITPPGYIYVVPTGPSSYNATITGLKFTMPGLQPGGYLAGYVIDGTWSVSDGRAIVLQADNTTSDERRTGYALRRQMGSQVNIVTPTQAGVLGLTDFEDATHVTAKVVTMDECKLDSRLFVIAYFVQGRLVLRNGVSVGQYELCSTFAEQADITSVPVDPTALINYGATPQKVRRQPNGQVVSIVDTFGFESQVDTYRQGWHHADSLDFLAGDKTWNYVTSGSGGDLLFHASAISVNKMVSHGRCASIGVNVAGEGTLVQRTGLLLFDPLSNSVPSVLRNFLASFEFELAYNETMSTSNSMSFAVGLFELDDTWTAAARVPNVAAHAPGYAFVKDNTSASLQTYTADGSATSKQVASVLKAGMVPSLFRIVLGNSLVKVGSSYESGVLFYIDGKLVGSHWWTESPNYMASGARPLSLALQITSASGSVSGGRIYFGPLSVKYRRPFNCIAY